MSPTVECSSRRLLHNVVCFPFQTWLTCLVTRWRGGASVDTSTCFHSPFLLLRTPHCSNITARRIQVLPHKGMPLTAASTFTTQHNYPPKNGDPSHHTNANLKHKCDAQAHRHSQCNQPIIAQPAVVLICTTGVA